MRKAFRGIIPALALVSSALCSPPRWVHELPSENTKNRIAIAELNGYWERPAASPYSVADSRSIIAAKEYIEIKDQNYSKIHLYAENVHGRKKVEIYRESGNIQINGPWILLTPERTGYYKNDRVLDRNPNGAEIPDPDGHKLVKKKNQKPLLYFLDSERLTLTPLALERMGQIYESGIYEGSTSPHDSESSSFLDALIIYNNKRHQKHGYIKRR